MCAPEPVSQTLFPDRQDQTSDEAPDGPGPEGGSEEAAIQQDENGNVTFLLSNQSFDINPVDIEVRLDGKVAIEGEFDVTGDQMPQHNWLHYRFQLESGDHELTVSSDRGEAQLATVLAVAGMHTVAVAFWHGRQVAGGPLGGFFTLDIRGQDDELGGLL